MGLPGTHARLNQWFMANQAPLQNDTAVGHTHQGLIMGTRGQQLASAMDEAERQGQRQGAQSGSGRQNQGDYFTGMRLLNQAFVNNVSPEKAPAGPSRLAIRGRDVSPSPFSGSLPGGLTFGAAGMTLGGDDDDDEERAFAEFRKKRLDEKRKAAKARMAARVEDVSDDNDFNPRPVASGSGSTRPVPSGSGKGKDKVPAVSPPNSDVDK